MPEATLTIPGRPISKKRPRFARRGNFVRTYSAQETEEGRTYLEIRRQWARKPLDCPVVLSMLFTCPIPSSKPKKWQQGAVTGEIKHISKPDIDNAGKFYLDVMNGLVFLDDKQVYELALEKRYGQEPRTEIKIFW